MIECRRSKELARLKVGSLIEIELRADVLSKRMPQLVVADDSVAYTAEAR